MLNQAQSRLEDAPAEASPQTPLQLRLSELYREHFDFVRRSLRRLGVRDAAIDDALQDVFLVVYRRLPEFQGSTGHRAWLFAIALRVAREARRRDARLWLEEPVAAAHPADHPDECAALRQRVELLDSLLAALSEEQREVFVMAEVEGFSAPEIAAALGIKLNTVYSRLRLGRQRFEQALARQRAVQSRERSR